MSNRLKIEVKVLANLYLGVKFSFWLRYSDSGRLAEGSGGFASGMPLWAARMGRASF